jgi:hypothetical protein
MSIDSDQPPSHEPNASSGPPPIPARPRSLADALELANSLDPNDRVRLLASLWESLPRKNRATILAFGIDHIHYSWDEKKPASNRKSIEPFGQSLWDLLFDPAKTAGLYSAPRRFDLATIFVVTAAYSLLFGAMTALRRDPITEVIVGLLITFIGVSQGLYQQSANPRGVSVVAGAIALSVMLGVVKLFSSAVFVEPFFIVVVLYGIIGGVICGYLAGVLVGGVFLIADVVRKWYALRFGQAREAKADDSNSPAKEESPWTT